MHPFLNFLELSSEDQQILERDLKMFTSSVQKCPADPKPYINLAISLRNYKIHDGAVKAYKEAIRLDPLQPQAYNNLGNILKSQGKLKDAIKVYKTAVQIDSNFATAYYNLGNALILENNFEEAIVAYRMANKIDPKSIGTYINLGLALEKEGRYEEAVNVYNSLLELKSDCKEAYNNLGLLLEKQEKFDEAFQAFHKAVLVDPNYTDAHVNIGNMLDRQGNFEDCIRSYKKAISINPKHSQAYNNLGMTLKNQGDLNEAIKVYTKAINVDSNNFIACNNLGLIFMSQGEADKAVKMYDKAIIKNPKYSIAYNNLGLALESQGKNQEALKMYTKALQIEPKCSYNNLENVLTNRDKIQESVSNFLIHSNLEKGNRKNIINTFEEEKKAIKDFNEAYMLAQNHLISLKNPEENKTDLTKLVEVNKITEDTKSMINGEVGRQELENQLQEFEALKKSKISITKQFDDGSGKLNSQCLENNQLQEQIRNIEEQMLKLQKTMLELNQKVQKHENVLKESGVEDKVSLKQRFEALREKNREVYKYCKSFYWTLLNYLMAYRTLETNLLMGNTTIDKTVQEKALNKGIQKGVNIAKNLIQTSVFPCKAIGIIDTIVDYAMKTAEKRTFNLKARTINKLVLYNNDSNIFLEDDINLVCATIAINVAVAKEKEILDSITAIEKKPTLIEGINYIKSNIKTLKNLIFPSVSVSDDRTTELALRDISMLLAYVYDNSEEILSSKYPLHKELEDVVILKKWNKKTPRTEDVEPQKQNFGTSPSQDGRCSIF